MAENITTLLDMDDAENISGDDYLYLVQGSGSKRDRKVRLGDIFASMEGWKRFAQYGETQNFELGEWDGDSVIMARPLISNHSSVYPSSVTVSQSQESGISIVVAELTDDGSCTLTYGSETATLHKGEIAILYSFAAVGNAIFRISVIPSAAFGIFEKLKVIGETILPGATFTPATSSGAVPVAKLSYLKVLESLDVEKGMTVKGEAEFDSVKGKTLDIAGRAKAYTFEGKVETNNISAKDSSKPINVSAISGFNITGKSSVSGDFSSGSLKTGKIAYENLNLNDNMGIAPVLPYFLDNNGIGIKNLSEILAEAPKGARITFINNSGKDKEYHFTTTDVEGVAGGYFTLKAGRAVDIIVNNVLSGSQVSLLPIGIDYEEGGNL